MEILKCQEISGVALAVGFSIVLVGFILGVILMFNKDNEMHLFKSLLISIVVGICVAYVVNINGPKEYIVKLNEEMVIDVILPDYEILEEIDSHIYKIRER